MHRRIVAVVGRPQTTPAALLKNSGSFKLSSPSLAESRCVHTTCGVLDQPRKIVEEKEGGWFSKLMGVQSIQPMKASHSSMLSDKEVVFELLTHDVKPGEMQNYLDVYQNHVSLIERHKLGSELLGSWRVAIGNQDQAVHIWKYTDGYPSADKTLEAVLSDKEIVASSDALGKLCTRRRNCFMLMFSFWGEIRPRPPKHMYELRTYVLKPGTMIEWGNNWARGIQHRRDFNQDVAGWFSQIGRLYMVFHLWAYSDMTTRKRIREEVWRKPGWDTNVAYTVPLIRDTESKWMIATEFSKLQ